MPDENGAVDDPGAGFLLSVYDYSTRSIRFSQDNLNLQTLIEIRTGVNTYIDKIINQAKTAVIRQQVLQELKEESEDGQEQDAEEERAGSLKDGA